MVAASRIDWMVSILISSFEVEHARGRVQSQLIAYVFRMLGRIILDRKMLLVYFRVMGTTMASSLTKIRLELPYPPILNAGILLCRSVVREGAIGMKGTPHQRLRPEQE